MGCSSFLLSLLMSYGLGGLLNLLGLGFLIPPSWGTLFVFLFSISNMDIFFVKFLISLEISSIFSSRGSLHGSEVPHSSLTFFFSS